MSYGFFTLINLVLPLCATYCKLQPNWLLGQTIHVPEENVLVHLGFAGLNAFKTKLNTSYDCPWSDPATLEQNDGDRNQTKAQIRVVMHNIQVEAFRNSTNNEFSKSEFRFFVSPIFIFLVLAVVPNKKG